MKAVLVRVLFAVLAVYLFWLLAPLFLAAIGLTLPASLTALLRIVVPVIALLYVCSGPSTGAPW